MYRFRDIREDNDMSQKEMAELLGIQTTVYARYEREENEIPLQRARDFAIKMNISLDYLAGICQEPRRLK